MLLWMAQKLLRPLGKGLLNLAISFAIGHPLAEVTTSFCWLRWLLPWLPDRKRACWAHYSAQGLSTHCVDLAAAPSNVQLRTPLSLAQCPINKVSGFAEGSQCSSSAEMGAWVTMPLLCWERIDLTKTVWNTRGRIRPSMEAGEHKAFPVSLRLEGTGRAEGETRGDNYEM